MVTQLFEKERILTTASRAKQLRKLADKMITYGKKVGSAIIRVCGWIGVDHKLP